MTSPTTHQGNIGQTAVTLDALRRGYHVSVPLEGAAYDLIVDRDGELLRVQVRSTTSCDGKITVRLRDSTSEKVDVLAMYDLASGKTYWIPFSKISCTHGFTLRLQETRQRCDWMAAEFEEF
jgi:hypothetical protein